MPFAKKLSALSGLKSKGRGNWVTAAFLALIVFGCALRFWKLTLGLWYDELWTVVGGSVQSLDEMYREWMLGDPHPPGFFFFYFLWFKVFPNDEVWSRLPSALMGVATVVYLLVGARRLFSRTERVITASLVALSYAYIFYGMSVKQYSPMLFWATAALVSCLEIIGQRRVDRRLAIWLCVSCVALAYLNYFAVAYVAILLAITAWELRAELQQLRQLVKLATVVVAACLPLVHAAYYMARYTPGDWQHDSFRTLLIDWLPELFFSSSVVPFAMGGFVLYAGWAVIRKPDLRLTLGSPRNSMLLKMVLAYLGFLLVLGLFKPVYFVRYFLLVFPGLLLGIGVVAAALFPFENWRSLFPLAFVAQAAVVQFTWVDRFQRQQWDKSVDQVLATSHPRDVIYVLGATRDKTSLEYVMANDEFGAYYVRNLQFYQYYFRRRKADAIAERLQVVRPSVEAAQQLVARYKGSHQTVFFLAGHHIHFDDASLAVLTQGAQSFEETRLFSTRVYKFVF